MITKTTEKEHRTANRRLAQWRVKWLIEHSTSHQLLWCIDSFVLQNPPLRQAPKRCASFWRNETKIKNLYSRMKIFPIKKYSIVLINERAKVISELKKDTLSDEQFVSNWNKQTFIGKVNETNFEIKLSKKLYGDFCVFKGILEEKKGSLEIEINKTFKIILSVIFLFPIIGFLTSLFKNGFENSVELIFPTIMFIIILRFVLIELGFQIISKNGINKLCKIIRIEI